MLRTLFCILVAGVWTSLMFPLAILSIIVTLRPGSSMWVARNLWSPVLLWAGGARLVVHGAENVDPERPTIYVSNHQSTIDIPALTMAVRVNFRYVAKHQLLYVPFVGWYLWLAGHILINRANRASAVASLDRAARKIRRGISIALYPEGTRSEGEILPFKKGPFALALEAGVAVCPVTIEGSGRLMPKNSWRITPGPIHVMIGAPISAAAFGPDDREGLSRAVRKVVIDQSLALGGRGGDRDQAIAPPGPPGQSPVPSAGERS